MFVTYFCLSSDNAWKILMWHFLIASNSDTLTIWSFPDGTCSESPVCRIAGIPFHCQDERSREPSPHLAKSKEVLRTGWYIESVFGFPSVRFLFLIFVTYLCLCSGNNSMIWSFPSFPNRVSRAHGFRIIKPVPKVPSNHISPCHTYCALISHLFFKLMQCLNGLVLPRWCPF